MAAANIKQEARLKRQKRIRKNLVGTAERPRLMCLEVQSIYTLKSLTIPLATRLFRHPAWMNRSNHSKRLKRQPIKRLSPLLLGNLLLKEPLKKGFARLNLIEMAFCIMEELKPSLKVREKPAWIFNYTIVLLKEETLVKPG